MNILIVYASKYGATEKCAKALSEKLKGNVDLCNLKEVKNMDLTEYDNIIIGGSIYMGRIQKEVTKFCTNNLDALQGKKVGLFICCMQNDEAAEIQLNNAFPQELLSKARAKEVFGGEFIFKKMKAIDRFIVKKIAKTNEDISTISEEKIDSFAKAMNAIG